MRFAIPSVISMLVNALYNIVDQIFIGQGVGYLGNAATTVTFPLMTILLAIGTMLGAGGSAYAAIKLGEKKEDEAENTLGNEFLMLLVKMCIRDRYSLLHDSHKVKLFLDHSACGRSRNVHDPI